MAINIDNIHFYRNVMECNTLVNNVFFIFFHAVVRMLLQSFLFYFSKVSGWQIVLFKRSQVSIPYQLHHSSWSWCVKATC